MRYLFKSHNLIGDCLYISPALRAWLREHLIREPVCISGDEVIIQTLPDHVAPLYYGMVRDYQPFDFKIFYNRPEGKFDFEHVFDVSAAFAVCDKEKCHVAEGYAKLLGVRIDTLKPTFIPEWTQEGLETKDWIKNNLKELEGCILISAFSASCESRDKNHPGLPPNKMLPWEKWKPLMRLIRESYPGVSIRFLGSETDMIPNGYAQGIVEPGEYMLHIPLNSLALIMQKARLLVTIDNGMSHLGASQEVPTFLMYPRCLGPHYILPAGNPNLVWCHMDPYRVNPAQLRHSLKFAIEKFKAKEK